MTVSIAQDSVCTTAESRKNGSKQNTGPKMPPNEIIKAMNEFWMDSNVYDLPEDILYRLYPQPTRGGDAKGSYLVRLPPGYYESQERYPVLLWLHGGMGPQRQALWALEHYAKKMEEGKMPKAIVVGVQGLPVGWWADSKDGARKIATIVSSDLICHLDQTWRTIAKREARWLEGFSMGGYGALHLGFRYPETFGALSSIAGALLPRLDQEPLERVGDTFFGDQDFYDQCHPYHLLRANGDKLRGRTIVRLLSGSDDTRLSEAIARMDKRMTELQLPHRSVEVKDVDHVYEEILKGVGDYCESFWMEASSRIL